MKRIVQSVGPFKSRMVPPLTDPRITPERLSEVESAEDDQAIQRLIQFGMTGKEAETFLFLSLGRLSALPLQDSDFIAAAIEVFELKTEYLPDLQRLAADWKPYGAVAAWYLKQFVGLQPEQRDA